MTYWTPTIFVNLTDFELLQSLSIFKTRRACQRYIDHTFPPALRKLGKIKPRRIKIELV